MGSDLFALSALAEELDGALKGARIDKIQQPEEDELRFFVRTPGKNLTLRVSCNAGAPGIYITESKKQSPASAPAFCMLLRKYLSSANITDVTVYNFDRIIRVSFSARTEMRDHAVYYLFAEIMNRYSNIVFTDEKLTVLDAVKKLTPDNAKGHLVMRGVKYIPVKQEKISYLSDCFHVFDRFNGGDLHSFILNNISGFSGNTVNELIKRAGLENDMKSLTTEDRSRLESTIEKFRSIRGSELYSPCVIGKKDVYPFPYFGLSGEAEKYETISEAYDALNTAADNAIRHSARLKSLNAAAKRLKQRAEKNIAIDSERLAECESMEKYRLFGELIVTNIYKIKRGDAELKCVNYYDNSEITVPLDITLSPSKNSAAYYNKYNKMKRTKEFTEKKLIKDKALYEYTDSVIRELDTLPVGASSADIEDELIRLGGIKRKAQKGKVRKERREPPDAYTIEGFTVYAGRNNVLNEEVTFKIANSSDIWLHMKNRHGAHVIIKTEGNSVPESVIIQAAEIAAASESAPVEVDYTERRNVKRQPEGHPGMVIYVNYKTVIATPNKHAELLSNW